MSRAAVFRGHPRELQHVKDECFCLCFWPAGFHRKKLNAIGEVHGYGHRIVFCEIARRAAGLRWGRAPRATGPCRTHRGHPGAATSKTSRSRRRDYLPNRQRHLACRATSRLNSWQYILRLGAGRNADIEDRRPRRTRHLATRYARHDSELHSANLAPASVAAARHTTSNTPHISATLGTGCSVCRA